MRSLVPLGLISALVIGCSGAREGTQAQSSSNFEASASSVVISQVFGGGGNPEAAAQNDFVELFNRGKTDAPLAGMSVQYASSSAPFSASADVIALPATVTLKPGQWFLLRLGTNGDGGAPIAHADLESDVTMSKDKGKVALVTQLLDGCGATGAAACTGFVDLVGYGNASQAEGAPTPALSNQTSAIRKQSGCLDTNENAANFDVGAPLLHSTLTEPVPCPEVIADAGPDATDASADADASTDADAAEPEKKKDKPLDDGKKGDGRPEASPSNLKPDEAVAPLATGSASCSASIDRSAHLEWLAIFGLAACCAWYRKRRPSW